MAIGWICYGNDAACATVTNFGFAVPEVPNPNPNPNATSQSLRCRFARSHRHAVRLLTYTSYRLQVVEGDMNAALAAELRQMLALGVAD